MPERSFGDGLVEFGSVELPPRGKPFGTETGPGHATLSTGTMPSVHGICANIWYSEGKPTYCVDDPAVPMLGAKEGNGRSARS